MNKTVLFLPLALLLLLPFSAAQLNEHNDTLLFYLAFEGNVADSLNVISPTNGGTTNITGIKGNARHFDGISNNINLGTNIFTTIKAGQNYTISWWEKPSSKGAYIFDFERKATATQSIAGGPDYIYFEANGIIGTSFITSHVTNIGA